MNIKNTIPAIAAIAIAISFQACSENDKNTAPQNNSISFTTLNGSALYRLENTAQVFMTDNDVAYQDSASLLIPAEIYGHKLDGLKDSIMKAAFDTVSTDINVAMDAFFRNAVAETGYQYAPNDSIQRSDREGMTLVTGDVFNLSTRLLTYRVSNYSYSPGAAHGITITNYITFDLRNGQIIELDDIFTADGLAGLPALIKARATELAPAIGPTNIESLPARGNFYITLDGSIVFVYQPYEVASYAQGAIAIPFYPYQLSEMMTAEGLALFDLNS